MVVWCVGGNGAAHCGHKTGLGAASQEVVGGMLDVAPRTWLKPRGEDFPILKDRVLRLVALWQPFDWTETLRQANAS